jgi:cell division protein FtsW
MARTLKSDKTLFLLTVLLVGVSLVMVYSASFVMAVDRHDSEYYFLYRQATWALLGFGLMYVVMHIDYRHYNRPAIIWGALAVTVILLAAVLVTGPVINGTRRWFNFKVMSFQPSELAKLSAVLFTAAVLDRRMHRIGEVASALVPIGLVTLTFVSLILLEPDYGTSAVILAVVLAMTFAAGIPYRHLFAVLVPVVTAGVVLVVTAPYRLHRLLAFRDPFALADNEGYQAVQSLFAIGSGGLLGRGLMEGQQKLYYLPEAHTDFIFSVIGEEFGLIGTTFVLACFAILAWRGLRVALLAPDRFGSLLALGITTIIAVQALVNISVVTVVMPTKGIALPFISNGGSSLLMSLVGMGVLLNISQHSSATARTSSRASDWSIARQEA